MLLKAKQIDFDTLVSALITYLNANPDSKQFFIDLATNNLVQTTPNPSYIENVAFSNITDTTVDLAWDSIASASTYEIEIKEFGNSLSTQRIEGITSTEFTVTDLNPSMTYDITVRAII